MESTTAPPLLHARIQDRTVALLSVAQVLGGLGAGATVMVGSMLAVQLSGSEAWAGSVTTLMTLGTAAAAMPLARLAAARGRRLALSLGLGIGMLGALSVVLAALLGSFPVLLAGGALLGASGAVNLQARFAATDLSAPGRRGRDLSLVVWMGTIGSVAGPNLVGVSRGLAGDLGLPPLAGIFVVSAAGMLAAMAVLWAGLRPDPYLTARGLPAPGAGGAGRRAPGLPGRPRGSFRAGFHAVRSHPRAAAGLIGVVSGHAVMVAVMSMTSVHLAGHGSSIPAIGLTISLHIAGMYALSPVMGALVDRFGGTPVVFGGLATLLAAVALAGLGGANHALVTAGLVLLGLGWSAATVAGSTMVAGGVSDEERIGVQGVSDTLMSLAGAGGGALAGAVLGAVGFGGLNLAAGVVVAAAAVAVSVQVRRAA